MRKLVLAVTLMTLALVLGVIAYFMTDVILTTNNNIDKNKQMTLEKTILQLKGIAERVGGISSDPRFLEVFNQERLQEILAGDEEILYETAVLMAAGMNPLDRSITAGCLRIIRQFRNMVFDGIKIVANNTK